MNEDAVPVEPATPVPELEQDRIVVPAVDVQWHRPLPVRAMPAVTASVEVAYLPADTPTPLLRDDLRRCRAVIVSSSDLTISKRSTGAAGFWPKNVPLEILSASVSLWATATADAQVTVITEYIDR